MHGSFCSYNPSAFGLCFWRGYGTWNVRRGGAFTASSFVVPQFASDDGDRLTMTNWTNARSALDRSPAFMARGNFGSREWERHDDGETVVGCYSSPEIP